MNNGSLPRVKFMAYLNYLSILRILKPYLHCARSVNRFIKSIHSKKTHFNFLISGT